MSDEKTTALVPAAQQLAPVLEKKSLLNELAATAGVEPEKFYAAVKVAAGCRDAQDAHFLVLLMQAQKYGLDPLSSPPQLQLLNVGNGPQVYARLDAYKAFLQRAEASGKIEWRRYEEGWFPDPRVNPSTKTVRRGGKVTMKLRGMPDPVEKIVWLDEWHNGEKSQWQKRASHMLEGRAWKEVAREYLGFLLYDEDDAERIGQSIRQANDVTVSDTAPSAAGVRPTVPIVGLRPPGAATFSPPPAPLGETPQETAPGARPDEREGSAEKTVGNPEPAPVASPESVPAQGEAPPLPDPQSEEGKRLAAELDAEFAREEAKRKGGLFDA